MRRIVGLAAAAAMGAAVAGCGGGSSGTTSAPAAQTTAPAVTTQATKPVPAAVGFATSANCRKLALIGSTFAQAAGAGSGQAQPKLADEVKALQAMADAAPSEISGDFRTMAGALGDFAQVWDEAGLAPGETPSPTQIAKLVAASQKLAQTDVQTAAEHVSTWVAENCGLKGTPAG